MEDSVDSKLKHPCFPQPRERETRAWRYLDLSKLIWLLSTKKLYLPRLDLLSDPHEGSTPRLLAQARDAQMRKLAMPNTPDMGQMVKNLRRAMYVSCWHLGNNESEAMWRLYCPSNRGVAIQTTYAALFDSFSSHKDIYVGKVTYIDYELQFFPANNLYYPVMHKRLSFSHEQEVRAVKLLPEHVGTAPFESQPGQSIDWPTADVVHALYINPYAPEYYRDVVCSVVRALAPELEQRVSWSRMRNEPAY